MLGNIMQNWRVLLASSVVVAIASGVCGFKVGHVFGFKSGYSAGIEAEKGNHAQAALKEADKSAKALEKEMSNAKKLSNDDVDAGLNALGIMRNDSDR